MDIAIAIGVYLLFLVFELFSIYCHDSLPNCGHGSYFTFSPSVSDLDKGVFLSILSSEQYYADVIIPYELYSFKLKEIKRLDSDNFPFFLFFPALCAVGGAISRIDGANILFSLSSLILLPVSSFVMQKLYKRSSWSLPAFNSNEFYQLENVLRAMPRNAEYDDGIRPSARINNRMNEIHAHYIDSVYDRVMRRCYMRQPFELVYFLVFFFIGVVIAT